MIGYLLINGVFSMISGLLMYMFLKFNFKYSCSKKRLSVFLITFGIVNGIVSTLWMKYINLPEDLQLFKSIIMLILSAYTINIILKTNWTRTIVSFFIVLVGIGIGNYLTPFICYYIFSLDITVKTVTSNVLIYFLVNIIIHIIATAITFVVIQLFRLRKIKNLKMITILLCGLFATLIMNTSSQFSDHFELGSFIRVSVSIVIFIVVGMILINKYMKSEELKKELSEELNLQKLYNASFKDTLLELRRFKHDQTNHNITLASMIRSGKAEEAINYLNEIQANMDNLNTAIYNIENVAIQGIISSKMIKAKEKGINFDLQVVGTTDTIPDVKISEICELFGIYLDNAIEAAEMSSDKKVEMLIVNYPSYIEIKLCNSCSEAPKFEKLKNDGYSTKGIGRGHGLAIAERILKKYENISSTSTFYEILMSYDQVITIKKTPE